MENVPVGERSTLLVAKRKRVEACGTGFTVPAWLWKEPLIEMSNRRCEVDP